MEKDDINAGPLGHPEPTGDTEFGAAHERVIETFESYPIALRGARTSPADARIRFYSTTLALPGTSKSEYLENDPDKVVIWSW